MENKIEIIENADLKCMSFNLLMGDSTGTYSTPKERGPWQVETIKKYAPDILGVQESCRAASFNGYFDAVQNIIDNCPEYTYYGWEPKGSNSMYWKTERFYLKEKGFMAYDPPYGNFGIPWLLLHDKIYDKDVLFTNVHLAPGWSEEVHKERDRTAAYLLRLWDRFCNDGVALCATGDYNCDINCSTLKLLSQGKYKNSLLVTPSKNAEPWIDHVFINGEVQECAYLHLAMETFEPEGVDPATAGKKYWASDHQALISYCNYIKKA